MGDTKYVSAEGMWPGHQPLDAVVSTKNTYTHTESQRYAVLLPSMNKDMGKGGEKSQISVDLPGFGLLLDEGAKKKTGSKQFR